MNTLETCDERVDFDGFIEFIQKLDSESSTIRHPITSLMQQGGYYPTG